MLAPKHGRQEQRQGDAGDGSNQADQVRKKGDSIRNSERKSHHDEGQDHPPHPGRRVHQSIPAQLSRDAPPQKAIQRRAQHLHVDGVADDNVHPQEDAAHLAAHGSRGQQVKEKGRRAGTRSEAQTHVDGAKDDERDRQTEGASDLSRSSCRMFKNSVWEPRAKPILPVAEHLRSHCIIHRVVVAVVIAVDAAVVVVVALVQSLSEEVPCPNSPLSAEPRPARGSGCCVGLRWNRRRSRFRR